MLKSLVPKLMKTKGWTAVRLQKEVDISWQNAWNLSHGKVPGTQTLNKLCKTFECQPSDIILYKEGE